MHRPVLPADLVVALSLVLCSTSQAALLDRGNGMIYDTDRNITWVSDADLFGTMRAADPSLGGYGLIDRIIGDVGSVSDGRTTHTLSRNDFSATSVGANSGLLSWWGAMAFAQDLVYGGFDDWRLPTSLQPDSACSTQRHLNGNGADISSGTGCTGSELGHLFYSELGGMADVPLTLTHNSQYGLFSNVRTDDWTGTPFLFPSAGDAAWLFDTTNGRQSFLGIDSVFAANDSGYFSFAWIVRTGDVAAVGQPIDNVVPEPETLALTLGGLGLMGVVRRRRPRAEPARATRRFAAVTGVLVAGLVSGAAQAALVDNGGGLIYDTDRNITWAQDVSLLTTMYNADPHLVEKIIAAVPTVTENGHVHLVTTTDFMDYVFMTANRVEGSWWGDVAFAQYVSLGGTGGWRLPTTLTPDPSCSISGGPAASPLTGCTGSEMGHVYYSEFGAHFVTGMPSDPGNYALFDNFESAGGFWSGTTYDDAFFPNSAFFFTPDGRQGLLSDLAAYATPWIVHDGDIGAAAQPVGGSAVPEPAVVSLLFAGAGAIGVVGRRHRLCRKRSENA